MKLFYTKEERRKIKDDNRIALNARFASGEYVSYHEHKAYLSTPFTWFEWALVNVVPFATIIFVVWMFS